MLKTTAFAFLLFITLACTSKDATPSPAIEVAGTYNVSTFLLNNRTISVTKGTLTISQKSERITISDLNVNGTSYSIAAELDVKKESNGDIMIGDGYGIYKNRILELRFGVVSGGIENTYQLKSSKL